MPKNLQNHDADRTPHQLCDDIEELKEAVEYLSEARQKIKDILDECIDHVSRADSAQIEQRAEVYWMAHIAMALDADNDFMQSDFGDTMKATEDEMEEVLDGWKEELKKKALMCVYKVRSKTRVS